MNIHPEYIVDDNSNKKSVVIPFTEWREIVEEIEELEDIRAYDRAKQDIQDELVPFDEAVMEIRAGKLQGSASEPEEHRAYVAEYAGDIWYGDVKLPLLGNCSCIAPIPSIHGRMLTPLTYIPVGNARPSGPDGRWPAQCLPGLVDGRCLAPDCSFGLLPR